MRPASHFTWGCVPEVNAQVIPTYGFLTRALSLLLIADHRQHAVICCLQHRSAPARAGEGVDARVWNPAVECGTQKRPRGCRPRGHPAIGCRENTAWASLVWQGIPKLLQLHSTHHVAASPLHHPGSKERLLAEIDAFGRTREVSDESPGSLFSHH